jgi:hypothetical protein
MELETLLPSSQETSTDLYHELDKSTPYHFIQSP